MSGITVEKEVDNYVSFFILRAGVYGVQVEKYLTLKLFTKKKIFLLVLYVKKEREIVLVYKTVFKVNLAQASVTDIYSIFHIVPFINPRS
jgi:hypothetical protein